MDHPVDSRRSGSIHDVPMKAVFVNPALSNLEDIDEGLSAEEKTEIVRRRIL
jgi:hypothetical protein